MLGGIFWKYKTHVNTNGKTKNEDCEVKKQTRIEP